MSAVQASMPAPRATRGVATGNERAPWTTSLSGPTEGHRRPRATPTRPPDPDVLSLPPPRVGARDSLVGQQPGVPVARENHVRGHVAPGGDYHEGEIKAPRGQNAWICT